MRKSVAAHSGQPPRDSGQFQEQAELDCLLAMAMPFRLDNGASTSVAASC